MTMTTDPAIKLNEIPLTPYMRAQMVHLLAPLPTSLYVGDETRPDNWWGMTSEQQSRAIARARQIYKAAHAIGRPRVAAHFQMALPVIEDYVDMYRVVVQHRKPYHTRNFRTRNPEGMGRPTKDPARKGQPEPMDQIPHFRADPLAPVELPPLAQPTIMAEPAKLNPNPNHVAALLASKDALIDQLKLELQAKTVDCDEMRAALERVQREVGILFLEQRGLKVVR